MHPPPAGSSAGGTHTGPRAEAIQSSWMEWMQMEGMDAEECGQRDGVDAEGWDG